MDKKNTTKQVTDLEILGVLADAYAQISSSRMKATRGSVLSSREFLEDMQQIFKELQASYTDEFQKLLKKKGIKNGQKLKLISHNGKTVAVFISANTGFYGDLTRKVFNKFIQEVRERDYEATIVGTLGLEMFRQSFPDKSYSYFDLPDFGFDREKMGDLVRHLVEYEEIHIFYGKFKSIINQDPEEVVISAETPVNKDEKGRKIKYLFEPSLEEILMFFEKEMFSSIFEQTITESQLAKFASRMLAMDQAGEKVRKNLEIAKTQNLKLAHARTNKKQLEYLSTVVSQRRFI
ncbi:MAG TPA: F0F1 ATP synthase subunit gamma [Patescibacteria group bacterium]|nr:F0F1 ATP synthase subunit gamma [Patescibacteria group bacterium]